MLLVHFSVAQYFVRCSHIKKSQIPARIQTECFYGVNSIYDTDPQMELSVPQYSDQYSFILCTVLMNETLVCVSEALDAQTF